MRFYNVLQYTTCTFYVDQRVNGFTVFPLIGPRVSINYCFCFFFFHRPTQYFVEYSRTIGPAHETPNSSATIEYITYYFYSILFRSRCGTSIIIIRIHYLVSRGFSSWLVEQPSQNVLTSRSYIKKKKIMFTQQ